MVFTKPINAHHAFVVFTKTLGVHPHLRCSPYRKVFTYIFISTVTQLKLSPRSLINLGLGFLGAFIYGHQGLPTIHGYTLLKVGLDNRASQLDRSN